MTNLVCTGGISVLCFLCSGYPNKQVQTLKLMDACWNPHRAMCSFGIFYGLKKSWKHASESSLIFAQFKMCFKTRNIHNLALVRANTFLQQLDCLFFIFRSCFRIRRANTLINKSIAAYLVTILQNNAWGEHRLKRFSLSAKSGGVRNTEMSLLH